MSDRQIGIPENRAMSVSAALHNSVVQGYADRIKELESALASERAKRVEAEADLDRVIRARNRYEVALNAAEANIERVRAVTEEMSDEAEYPLELWWRTRIIGALSNADTSALARHDAEVAARALEEVADEFEGHGWQAPEVAEKLRARAAEKRVQGD